MKILGVDPGTNVLGFAMMQIEGEHVQVLDVGVIRLDSRMDHQTRLKEIFLQLQEVIETYLPSVMAIEAPFFGKNVQSMLKLGRAQGVAMAAAMTMGLEIAEYSPKKIKQSVTGNGNAAKEQVAAMLCHLLSYNLAPLSYDASDALAAAYCHYLKSTGTLPSQGSPKTNWKKFIQDNPGRLR